MNHKMLPFVELELRKIRQANRLVIKEESEIEIFESLLVTNPISFPGRAALAICDKANADIYNHRQKMYGKNYFYIVPGKVVVTQNAWDISLENV